ncbi:MAG: DUF459 domain-containing protein [Pseudanabaenaceae cyanobacterium]
MQLVQKDITVMIMSAVIGSILIGLYWGNLSQVLEREAVFIKPQTTSEIVATDATALNNIPNQQSQNLEALLPQQTPAPEPEFMPPRPNRVPAGASFLLIGDSMMQDGIGSELENSLKALKASRVFRKAIQSTGLLHPERLNWYAEVDRLLAQRQYDVVVIMLGLNDADHIRDANGVYQNFGTPQWKLAYARKVEQMLNQLLIKNKVKRVVWVGLPVGPDPFWDNNVRVLNEVYRTVVSRNLNAAYVDTYNRFLVNGRWSAVVKDDRGVARTARQADGLHMTIHGGRIMADLIIDVMKKNEIIVTKPLTTNFPSNPKPPIRTE